MTIYYSDRYITPFPVPLLAFERLANLQERGDEEAIYKVLVECCGVSEPTDTDYSYFITRVSEVVNAKAGSPEPKKLAAFGRALENLLDALKAPDILLIATGYDYPKARYLYCEADREIAMAVIEGWVKLESHRHNLALESVLYGNGGRYKEDGGSDGKTVDLDKLSAEESVAAMQALFG